MRLVIIFAVIIGVLVACNVGGDDEPVRSGPSGMYTPQECLVFQWNALDDSQPEDVQTDAAAKYQVHCQP
ncbi:hypothetical protein G7043_31295 [Lentzea sp. NEAU-D13]|uniref:Lipoprotein n=1 Tax=Lentzea alba TaxID=2714351 RepID=A0A7C9W0E0_9PSEU|nr:hypothetical protein [Lentzea alba]NGY63418.1 hypothetical protein [Lentzea alba]